MRVAIIGAGPTGLGAAHRLAELGETDFTVYDRNPYVGGLATTIRDDKGFLWDFAVHVAHSHYHYVDKLMDELLPGGFYHHERRSWVREYGAYVPYPFQYNFRNLPKEQAWECVKGLLDLRGRGAPSTPGNFKEWILNAFGEGIAKHFMVPYNAKIWCVDPSEMGYQWIGDRVPEVDFERVLRNLVLEQQDVAWGPNATFQFPKKGGTGAIWKELAARLPAGSVRLETEIVAIDPKTKTLRLADGSTDRYDHLVSTMPVPVLADLCGLAEVSKRAHELQHTHVYVVCVAPEFPIPEELAEKTWLYCPEEAAAFYRVTPFSIFSPDHVPDVSRQCSFLCEISRHGSEPLLDAETLIEPTLNGLRDIGLVDCDPARTHVFTMTAEYGYPIPTTDRDEILADVLPALEAHDIYSRGRFGGWKYEAANMDHSLMQGVEAANRIVLGEEEITLAQPNVVNAGKR